MATTPYRMGWAGPGTPPQTIITGPRRRAWCTMCAIACVGLTVNSALSDMAPTPISYISQDSSISLDFAGVSRGFHYVTTPTLGEQQFTEQYISTYGSMYYRLGEREIYLSVLASIADDLHYAPYTHRLAYSTLSVRFALTEPTAIVLAGGRSEFSMGAGTQVYLQNLTTLERWGDDQLQFVHAGIMLPAGEYVLLADAEVHPLWDGADHRMKTATIHLTYPPVPSPSTLTAVALGALSVRTRRRRYVNQQYQLGA